MLVRQSRHNSGYGNQKLVVNISKFPPDTDMLFKITKNKNRNCFILMGAFACSWCIINRGVLFLPLFSPPYFGFAITQINQAKLLLSQTD